MGCTHTRRSCATATRSGVSALCRSESALPRISGPHVIGICRPCGVRLSRHAVYDLTYVPINPWSTLMGLTDLDKFLRASHCEALGIIDTARTRKYTSVLPLAFAARQTLGHRFAAEQYRSEDKSESSSSLEVLLIRKNMILSFFFIQNFTVLMAILLLSETFLFARTAFSGKIFMKHVFGFHQCLLNSHLLKKNIAIHLILWKLHHVEVGRVLQTQCV